LIEEIPFFNTVDVAIASFNALFALFGIVILYPALAAIFRIKKLRKQYLAKIHEKETRSI